MAPRSWAAPGSYLGSIAGALLLTVLTGLLPILRLPEGALRVVYGLVILGTVALAAPQVQALMSRRRGRGKGTGAATTAGSAR